MMGFGNPKYEPPGSNRDSSSVVSPKAILGQVVEFANQARAALPQARSKSFLRPDEVRPSSDVHVRADREVDNRAGAVGTAERQQRWSDMRYGRSVRCASAGLRAERGVGETGSLQGRSIAV